MFTAYIAGLVLMQNQEAKITSVEKTRTLKRSTSKLTSRHKSGLRIASATCYNVSENGSRTASGSRFTDGPEYYCAMPTNLNPSRKYCRHSKGVCNSILVTSKHGTTEVHVIDHCPKPGVIDFNHAAANKIFLGIDSSSKKWWSRSSVRWQWK